MKWFRVALQVAGGTVWVTVEAHNPDEAKEAALQIAYSWIFVEQVEEAK